MHSRLQASVTSTSTVPLRFPSCSVPSLHTSPGVQHAPSPIANHGSVGPVRNRTPSGSGSKGQRRSTTTAASLVPTSAPISDVALAHDAVKVVAMQPATTSGRYELSIDPRERLTLSDVVEAVVRAGRARVGADDFVPIPCSHPQCGWITVFLRRFGLVHNVVKYVDLEKAMAGVAYKTLLSTGEIQAAVGTRDEGVVRRVMAFVGKRLVRSTDMFSIAIKPFMDRFDYDQDRVANCCHHMTTTGGELVSFCEYNALDRPTDRWERLPTIEHV